MTIHTSLGQSQLFLAGSLARMKPFKDVAADVTAKAETACRLLKLQRDRMLFAGGDRSDQVYFIIQGQIRCLYHSAAGRLVTLADLGPGEMVGELAAIDGQPRTVDVIALVDTILVVMPPVTFRELLFRDEQVAQCILSDMTRRMRVMTGRLIELSTLEVGARVRSEIIRLAGSHPIRGTAVSFPAPRHADLGSRISANREAVTREMIKLTRARLIEKRQRQLVIPNLAEFRQSLAELVAGLPPMAVEQAR